MQTLESARGRLSAAYIELRAEAEKLQPEDFRNNHVYALKAPTGPVPLSEGREVSKQTGPIGQKSVA